jgi:TonB dependent receptor/Carboxypeptidase regulatory-like domain
MAGVMNGRRRVACATSVTIVIALVTLAPAAVTAQTTGPFRGRSLSDALLALQATGLRIVFSSAIVTRDMRVHTEPRATNPKQLLDELLAPHGLKAVDGAGGVIQIVRAEPRAMASGGPGSSDPSGSIEGRVVHVLTRAPLPDVTVRVEGITPEVRTDATGRFVVQHVDPGARTIHASTNGFLVVTRVVQVTSGTKATVTLALSPAVSTYSEHVTVSGSRPRWRDRGVASELTLERGEFVPSGGVADDPIRTVQALPGVSVADDFYSEFTVRGSPFRHVEVVIDGVPTPWLQHTTYGRGATGSLTMLTSDIVEDATLRVGAYPRRVSDRLGAELDLALKEGSRRQFQLRGAVGGINATIVADGPLGRSGQSARGSWLVAARQSYLEWPAVRGPSTRTPFGFSDGAAKVVYDVGRTQQAGLSVLAGASNVDGEESGSSSELGGGTNRTTVANAFWRSMFGASVVLTQRAYLVRHRFMNPERAEGDGGHGANDEIAYRADIARPLPGGLFEAGGQIERTVFESGPDGSDADAPAARFAAASRQRSGYAHFAWNAMPALTVSPGVRITDSTLLPGPVVARWILGEYELSPSWTLNVSAGASRQLPELYQVRGDSGPAHPRAERATYFDLGIEQRVGKAVLWQATFFNRDESDILREPDLYPRLVGDVIVDPPDPARYANSLSGSSRGVELLVDRKSTVGLSGWVAYSYGKVRYTDGDRGEAFWADFDRRHTLNIFATYRFSVRTVVGATFRAGSGFPIPAYVSVRDGVLLVADQRNQVRLPPYARLDLRASRAFEALGRRLTIFCDVANVLNRVNVGLADGAIRRSTGEAIGFTDTLLPRRASAGIVVVF